LKKEVRDLKVRMDEFAEELAPSAILRRRCASPVPLEGAENMEVDIEGDGTRPRKQRRPSEEELLPAGNMLIASSLMGINEAVRGNLCRLEVHESRSRRDPSLAPQLQPTAPPMERPVAEEEGKKTRGRKRGKTIPADPGKKRRVRKKKAEPPMIAVETPASSVAEPVPAGGEVQDTERASSQVSEPVPWAKVVRRGKTGGRNPRVEESGTPRTLKGPPLPPFGKGPKKGTDPLKATKRRVKRTAAVVVSGPGSYAKAMALARQKISLEEFGIAGIKVRPAFSRGLILEIPGERADAQASYLASSMKMAFEGVEELKDVRIAVPTQMSSLRLSSVEDSITDEEIRIFVAEAGGCSPKEILLGKWFALQGRLWNIVVQCPSRAAIRITESGAKVKIGWSFVRAVLLKKSILTCYRCLMRGHTQQRCPSAKDYSRCCKNCGKERHKAAECRAPAHCPVCAEKRRDFHHRMGSEACPPVQPRMAPTLLGSGRRKSTSSPVGGSPFPSTPGATLETRKKVSPSLPEGGSPFLSNPGLPSTSSRSAESPDEANRGKQGGAAVPPGMIIARDAKNRTDCVGSVSAQETGVLAEELGSGGSGGPTIVSDESVTIVAMDTVSVTIKKRTRPDTRDEDDSFSSPDKPPGKVASKKPARGLNRPGPKSRKGSV
jgi:hypothetical protein